MSECRFRSPDSSRSDRFFCGQRHEHIFIQSCKPLNSVKMKARLCCGMRNVCIEKPERNDTLSLLHSTGRRRLANLDSFLIFIFLTHYFYISFYFIFIKQIYIYICIKYGLRRISQTHTHTARTGSSRRTKAKIVYNGLRSFSLDVVASWLVPPLLLLCSFILLFFLVMNDFNLRRPNE